MRVTILGAGTAVPARRFSPAGIYVKAAREHVLLDAGPGTLERLLAIGVTFLDLDRIFLTHFHVDHCLDLATILFAARIPDPDPSTRTTASGRGLALRQAQDSPRARQRRVEGSLRTKPLTVYGPRGLRSLLRQLNAAFRGWLTPRGYRLTVQELGEATLRLPGYTVMTRRMDHYDTGAIGYRLTVGARSVAYSGDTDRCPAIVALGQAADLLVLECSMPDERKAAGHLTPSECGRIAHEARCRRLALTHFYPLFQGYDIRRRVRRSFRGRLTLARNFATFAV